MRVYKLDLPVFRMMHHRDEFSNNQTVAILKTNGLFRVQVITFARKLQPHLCFPRLTERIGQLAYKAAGYFRFKKAPAMLAQTDRDDRLI